MYTLFTLFVFAYTICGFVGLAEIDTNLYPDASDGVFDDHEDPPFVLLKIP
ncbi:MAG: hypothetical protein C00003105_01396 [ANME-2 cluster archaeon HR1]|nr:MAG: hypothetical protein C00003105_01396 [ANME-2 cluster archaeon HR1]